MPSECFILNEWLIHDLRGDNGQEAQEESFKFLTRLKEKCDRIAILNGSPWMEKAYELMRYGNLPIRTLSKYLHEVILLDPKKCHLLENNEIKTMSEDLKEFVSEDDLYLFEIYFSSNADKFITTDERLYQTLSKAQNKSIDIKLRNDFLKEYLKR